MKQSKISCLVICLLIFALLSQASANEATFKDVPKTHWAYEAIESLSKAGIVKGFPDKTFKPDLKVTREQFAVVLVLSLKLPADKKAPQTFSDIRPDHRSFVYIDAVKSLIPTPSNPHGPFNFNGNKAITREEVAEATVLALNLKKNPKANAGFLQSRFKDYQNISPLYREQVALAVYNGIISGNANGTFDGKGALTRAELSVIISKLIQETQVKQTLNESAKQPAKPPHKPWTIEFNFRQPDYDQVKTFMGTVISKVYGPVDSYMVLEHVTVINDGSNAYADIKSVNMYVYEKDLNWFFTGDMLRVSYDRNNNITSYSFEREATPHKFLPPVGGG